MRHLRPMLGAVLLVSGLFATVYGTWRGYVAARSAMLPLIRDGEPTRSLIDAHRPLHERSRVVWREDADHARPPYPAAPR